MEEPDFKAIFLSGSEGQVTYALNLTLHLKGKEEINSFKTHEGSILQFKMERSDQTLKRSSLVVQKAKLPMP